MRSKDSGEQGPGGLARARALVRAVFAEVAKDRVTGLAAEVAFFAVLSIFPGMMMLAAALGSLEFVLGGEIAQRSEELMVDFLDRILTEQAAGTISSVEALFEEGRGGVLTLSILLALWALSRGFAAAIRALNLAYGVAERRPWLRLRALALALSLGSVIMAAFVLATLVAGPLLGGGQALADTLGLGELFAFAWNWLRWPAAAVLLVGWATTLYHVAPNKKSPWRADIPGGLLVASLWLAVSIAFGVYLRVAAAGNPVLGVLGGGLIMLIWLYLLSLSLLVGGEFNAVLRTGKWKEATRE